ncbi:PDZ and LIM domain protein Zasp isoform X1 [Folsomia candida]|uniref:PDZ and LIM domain protein Zasp isoform X1 n=1 Tax=Folsomia candida TaxID=158441 RepID=UPI000B8F2AAD|nr:PDZ and LIM domain protein Zasp isoform X1 [Folsomia candida]
MATTLKLSRPNLGTPWGFRIHGGKDFGQPLVVLKVTANSIASQSGLSPGDVLLKINASDASNLTHKAAQDVIKNAGNSVDFVVIKAAGTTTWAPQVAMVTGGQGGQGADQFNTPINMYSDASIAETLSAQAEVLAGGAIGVNFKKNEKKYNYENSEVYKMLQEENSGEENSYESSTYQNSPALGRIVGSFGGGGQQHQQQEKIPPPNPKPLPKQISPAIAKPHPQQQQISPAVVTTPTQPINFQPMVTTPPAPQPSSAPGNTAPLAPGTNICADCERLIVGVFVRVKEKNLHVDCFKCSTCGQSLKNVGYFNINNKLYCDIHAKLVARQQNPGLVAGGMSPVATSAPTAPPATKPFSYTQPLPSLPSLPSQPLPAFQPLPPLASPKFGGGGPAPFQTGFGGPTIISHVTAPKSPNQQPLSQQPAFPSQPSSFPQQQQQQQQNYFESYESKQSKTTTSSTSFSSSEGSKVVWPPAGGVPSIGGGAPAPSGGVAPMETSPKFKQQHVPYQPLNSLLMQQPLIPPTAAPVAPPPASMATPPIRQGGGPQFGVNYSGPIGGGAIGIKPVGGAGGGGGANYGANQNYGGSGPNYGGANQNYGGGQLGGGASYGSGQNKSVGGASQNKTSNFGGGGKSSSSSILANRIGRGILNQPSSRVAVCGVCQKQIRGPFISTATKFYCPSHFSCASCSRDLMEIGFVDLSPNLHCEFCWEANIAPPCAKCSKRIKNECLKAMGRDFHPDCFTCRQCGKKFGKEPFFVEDGAAYCQADWNELFTTKCYGCGFPIEAGDRWVEAMSQNYHSQCFNCSACKKNLEGQSFFAKQGRPFCKSHAR